MFSVSLRWPPASATGHGVVAVVSDKQVSVQGRAGKLNLSLSNGEFEYRLSGHYKLADAQKSGLDLYFKNLKRVRALTFESKHGDAYMIFEVGGDK